MDEKFLSWLGLGITRRTCVTKSNCTPLSQNERCGKAFIFNIVSYLGTSSCMAREDGDRTRRPSISTFLPCKDSRKNFLERLFHIVLGVCAWLVPFSKMIV